jgi:hypothetical protein
MKRLVLLSVAALMLASAVFAPVAMAQAPAEVDIQTVTEGPEGSLQVTGTIECIAGHDYGIGLEARQAQGNQPVRYGGGDTGGTCSDDGPEFFSVIVLPFPPSKPFRKGQVVLTIQSSVCGPSFCGSTRGIEVFEVTK